jgi:hypothetical protein
MNNSHPTTAAWPWPDSLDALTAAPDYHELVLEDERVRVIITHIPPGNFVPLHTHRLSGVAYLLSASHFIRRDEHGNVLLDSRNGELPKTHKAQWLEPLPLTLSRTSAMRRYVFILWN